MKPLTCLSVLGLLVLARASGASSLDLLLGVPDMQPSWADADGALHEDWGVVALGLEDPAGAPAVSRRYEVSPVPTAVTETAAGAVTLTTSAYRAPVWPAGVDVLTARLRNRGAVETSARLQVALPERVGLGDRVGSLGARPVLALPAEPRPVRRELDWGCTGGVVPMPGWARPEGECDPAFRNIRAGMGGVPIIYRFAVPVGAERTVFLGLCESHWDAPGRRPVMLYAEGAPKAEIDPIAAWGQHKPGCLRFDARDADGDGRLQIVVAPHPQAEDKNTILNALWVFSPDVYVDTRDVLAGRASAAAEYYVDVGGEKDQLLYGSGPVTYEITLAPGAEQELCFLVACAGGSVPNPEATPWTPVSLRRAAEDVWGDWFARGARVALPPALMARWNGALARIMMTRAQADDFYAALPEYGLPDRFSHAAAARMILALDLTGHGDEAERMLRGYWDTPVPGPLAFLGQDADGRWRDPVEDPCAQGCALQALAHHALLSGDRDWIGRAWPAMERGARWLEETRDGALEARRAAAVGLLGAARVAALLGLADATRIEERARELDPRADWESTGAEDEAPVARAAAELVAMRRALVAEREGAVELLAGLAGDWLEAGALSAEGLPTEFGPVSLTVRRAPKALRVTVRLGGERRPEALVCHLPEMDGRKAVGARADGREVETGAGGEVGITPVGGLHRVDVLYP